MLKSSSSRQIARSLVLATGGLALVVWLQRDASWPALQARAGALPAWTWLLAALGWVGTYVLRAARLRAEWLRLERVSMGECLRIVLTHNVLLLLLPMRAGEVGYVWQVHRRWGASLRDAAASLLWLRVQDGCVLLLIAIASLPPWPAPTRIALALSLLLLGSSLLPLLVRAGRRRWQRLDQLVQLLMARRDDATGWVCSVANWSLKLGVLSCLFAALSGVSASSALRAAVGGEMAGALPLQAPAGVGTYELGAGLGYAIGADPAAQIVAAALVVHGFAVAATLTWAGLVHLFLSIPAARRTVSA